MSYTELGKPIRSIETAALFVAGFAVVATLHVLGGWWLNTGTGVLRTSLVLLALGVFAAFRRSGSPWVRACALWAGANAGSAAILFAIGPGTIWPIVLMSAAALTAAAVFAGTALGLVLIKRRR